MTALTQARERQEEARRIYEHKWDEASVDETLFIDTIKDTLEKAEAVERHVKTVTIRALCLATTEANFFKKLLDRQEEAQWHLNEFSAQRSTVVPAARTQSRLKQHSTPVHTTHFKS